MVERTSVGRSVLLVVVAAIIEAIIGPYLTFGTISPHLTLIAVAVCAFGLEEVQGLLLGFFGGVLVDALGEGLFGVGSLGGLVAAAIALRLGRVQVKGIERLLLTQGAAFSVAAYDIIHLLGTELAGMNGPPLGRFVLLGVLPDAVINGALAYLFGIWLLRRVRVRGIGWT